MADNLWIDLYTEFVTKLQIQPVSDVAKKVSIIAHEMAYAARDCIPKWRSVEKISGLDSDDFLDAFEELCEVGIVFHGVPSLLVCLADTFPPIPMFGPIGGNGRPSAEVWKKVRNHIFKRDNYTCAYCGKHGGCLECDHVVPVSRGGGNDDSNLVAACFSCNRSKKDKLVSEWRKS